MSDALAIADRFFAAIEAGDVDALRALYAPDAKIWHNNDGIYQDVDANVRTLKWIVRIVRDRSYEITRRVATPTGFAQEHVMRGTLPDGGAFSINAAIFCDVADGRITALNEYLDAAAAAPLVAFAKA